MSRIFFVTFNLLLIAPLFADLKSDPPTVVADYLLEQGMATRGYKLIEGDYTASSPYRELPSSGVMANNLAYYCEGSADHVSLVKIVLNVNSVQDAAKAHASLASAAKELHLKATGKELPPNLVEAIKNKQSKTWVIPGYEVAIVTKTWPTGRGYEIHFVIKLGS